MSRSDTLVLSCTIAACCLIFFAIPAQAFTADSLDISIQKNGDATATFRFTLEGFVENAIPQSLLEEELKKGLTTSSDPPVLLSMDRSSAVLLMKRFADTVDVPTGTEYRTATMDFSKAEVALQNSALNGVVTAAFTPTSITLTFPDAYRREFSNVAVLPSVTHTVIDPSKTPVKTVTPEAATGAINITSSPAGVQVFLDSAYVGEAPALFREVPAGTHTAEFRKDGYESATKAVTVLSGKTTSVMVVLRYIQPVTEEEGSPGIAWVFVLMVLVAAAGAGYYLWNRKKKQEADEAGEEAAGDDTAVAGDDDGEDQDDEGSG